MAYIITLGNEKGGTGKSTTAMHIFSAAAHSGYQVGILDLDLRQRSMGRYLENRQSTINHTEIALPMPEHFVLEEAQTDSLLENKKIEEEYFAQALHALDQNNQLIIIDCPGNDTNYSNMAHAVADTLVSPMNESYIDFDLFAKVDPITDAVIAPSVYSEMVWDAKTLRQKAGLPAIDWVVVRNRMSSSEMRNRRNISKKLKELSKRIGFRVELGLSERVIYRELFSQGLTLSDLPSLGKGRMNMSNVAARQELRDLMRMLKIDGFEFEI